MTSHPETLSASPLSRAAETLYNDILDQDGEYQLTAPTIEDDPPCKELLDCGLLGLTDPSASASPDRHFTAVDPIVARNRWLNHLHDQALQQFDAMESVAAAFDGLVSAYDLSKPTSGGFDGGFEAVAGLRDINARIGQLTAAATREIYTLQPGERPTQLIHNVVSRDQDAAHRVSWRTLYSDQVRHDSNVMDYISALGSVGAEFRTSANLIGRLILIDRRTAVVPAPTHSPSPVACFITEPNVVHHLRQVFLTLWRQALPLAPGQPSISSLPPIQQEIIALLREGLDQAEIMRRTGLKARTCSAQIADLKKTFDADTQFQLGMVLARSQP